ncbi:F0F1 ATP synthase subunit gamma [Stakelama tenebrarum]|uniref:Uncharacterized protein n=1 Tax=Stakelama tenebrarum TaxID=2711215 RepID=A0A6G6Y1Q9_9SPHN|nr:F0F1 ATP synthase subunit gamma [Sphingosinithalassobacter tenebrarum]QIG78874.1 hypothetical protein G5C33_03075 [Sphingosinithalassobacter tenebrarum]
MSTLIPFDYARFPVRRSDAPPLTTLSPDVLLPQLAEEYVFAELCEAVVLAFAAEQEARLRAMMSVSEHVKRSSEDLAAQYRQRRQEAITEEVVELAAGVDRETGS